MPRTLIAALAALAIALIAPAAASAQYAPPYFYPSASPAPLPVMPGLEEHPFTFGAHWAADSPLQVDFADYVAWRNIEDDYRLRAGAYDDVTYYGQSGLIGTTFSGPLFGGVDWEVRILRYVPPAAPRVGHFCVYEGFVNGPVMSSTLNTFTQMDRHCETYTASVEGL